MAFTRPRAAQIDFDVTNISDPLIRLNSAETGSADKDVGIVIERGDDTNTAIIYDESANEFAVINTTETGSTSGNVTIASYADIRAGAFYGDGSGLTGVTSYTDSDVASYLSSNTIATSNINVSGDVLPDADNTRSLGSASLQWQEVYIGPGSLYVNGKKVLEENAGTIVVTADADQSLTVKTTGTGVLTLQSATTVNVSGTLQIQSGNSITDSAGTAVAFGDPLDMNSNKITELGTPSASTDAATKGYVDTTAAGYLPLTGGTISSNLTVSGNFTVNGTTTTINTSTLSVADNLIDLNSDVTSGTPSQDAGIRILRGDSNAVQLRWNETNDKWELTTDGASYTNIAVTSDIPTAVSELTNDSGYITGYTVTQSDVTTHQAALSITESQISDLGSYITASSTDTLTNKTLTAPVISTISNTGTLTLPTSTGTVALTSDIPTNVSDLTNDSGYSTTTGTVTSVAGTGTVNGLTLSGTVTSSGNITLGGTFSATVSEISDLTATATELNYTDGVTSAIQTQLDAKLALAGGTMSGAIAMGTNKITGMGDPTANQDAATKAYVDTQTSSIVTTTDIAGDSGTDTVTLGSDTLTFSGTANEITTAVTNNTVTISLPDDVTIGSDLTVTGNLTVNGTTTTISTTNSVVSDSLIELNTGATSNANDLGIVMERGSTGDNAIFAWDESADAFVMGTTTATGASTGDLTIANGELRLDTLRIDQSGTGLRMTNVGAFDNDGSDNFRIFATNDLQLKANGDSGGGLSIDVTNNDVTIDNDLRVSAGQFYYGGTAVTSTATELNLLDGVTGTLVTEAGTQTLTNKTLTAPVISTISNTGTLTLPTSTGTVALTSDIPTAVSELTNDSGYITGYTVTQSDVTTHQAALSITESQISDLGAYATLASPTLTGTPAAPTATAGTNTTQIATTAFVSTAVANIVDSAPAALDTLNELAAALGDDANFATTTATSLGEKLVKASNLSDLTDAATARTNLGLGTAATTAATAYATAAQGSTADSAIQPGDNVSTLTNDSGYITASTTDTLTNKTLTSPQVNTNIDLLAQADLRFYDSDDSNYVGFQAPATASGNILWTLPGSDGTEGQVLSTNGGGTLAWEDPGSGGGSGSSYPNSTFSTVPGTNGDFDMSYNVAQTTQETPFESGGTDAFGVNLGSVFSLMDPIGTTESIDYGDSEAYVGA